MFILQLLNGQMEINFNFTEAYLTDSASDAINRLNRFLFAEMADRTRCRKLDLRSSHVGGKMIFNKETLISLGIPARVGSL